MALTADLTLALFVTSTTIKSLPFVLSHGRNPGDEVPFPAVSLKHNPSPRQQSPPRFLSEPGLPPVVVARGGLAPAAIPLPLARRTV